MDEMTARIAKARGQLAQIDFSEPDAEGRATSYEQARWRTAQRKRLEQKRASDLPSLVKTHKSIEDELAMLVSMPVHVPMGGPERKPRPPPSKDVAAKMEARREEQKRRRRASLQGGSAAALRAMRESQEEAEYGATADLRDKGSSPRGCVYLFHWIIL